MRKALVVGIDYYPHIGSLNGCVNDARKITDLLQRNADGSVNFPQPRLIAATAKEKVLQRPVLREAIEELFTGENEVALFYFAGHGHIDTAGGYLCAGDCRTGDDGIALRDIMTWASKSRARNKVVLLDSCYGGALGDHPMHEGLAELADGVTILTASTKSEYANEANGAGVFTTMLVDALNGAAANLLGDITPGSVYAHIDQSLGTWHQRPVFKTNIQRFISLRKVKPPVPLEDLRRISELFPTAGYQYRLDPSYEPESPEPIPEHKPTAEHNEIFAVLQKYNRVNLVVPVDAPHMWHAAVRSGTVRLTDLGEHYRRLVDSGLI